MRTCHKWTQTCYRRLECTQTCFCSLHSCRLRLHWCKRLCCSCPGILNPDHNWLTVFAWFLWLDWNCFQKSAPTSGLGLRIALLSLELHLFPGIMVSVLTWSQLMWSWQQENHWKKLLEKVSCSKCNKKLKPHSWFFILSPCVFWLFVWRDCVSVQICSLMRGGIAERGGVRVGHRIIEINSQSVVATPHEKIVQILSNAMGEVRAAPHWS